MKTTTANQQPEHDDDHRNARKYILFEILRKQDLGFQLSLFSQFEVIPATWTLREYHQAFRDLERDEMIWVSPYSGNAKLLFPPQDTGQLDGRRYYAGVP